MMSMRKISKGLSEEEVEHIAWLARIELSDEEKELFTRQFNMVMDYFHVIDEADTENVAPTFHILELANVFREDIVRDSLPNDVALANAPKKERGYFKAPKIV